MTPLDAAHAAVVPIELVPEAGPVRDQPGPLTEPVLYLGRSADCQYVLSDPHASRRHARLEWRAGAWYLSDLASSNGTTINGHAVSRTIPVLDGDLIEIGDSHLRVSLLHPATPDNLDARETLSPSPAAPAAPPPVEAMAPPPTRGVRSETSQGAMGPQPATPTAGSGQELLAQGAAMPPVQTPPEVDRGFLPAQAAALGPLDLMAWQAPARRRPWGRWLAIGAAVMVLLLAVGLVAGARDEPVTTTTQAASPSSAPGTSGGAANSNGVVVARGTVAPASQVRLSFKNGGLLQKIQVKVGQDVAAGTVLAEVDSTDLQFQVTNAQTALDQAKTDLDRISKENKDQNSAEVKNAQFRVKQAETALEQAKNNLAAAKLTAPVAGTIIALTGREGENLQPGAAVITLADISRWQVETTDLDEVAVGRLVIGQRAIVRLTALPDRTLNGKVASIATAPTVLANGDVTYTVIINLTDETSNVALKPGQTARVEIVTREGRP